MDVPVKVALRELKADIIKKLEGGMNPKQREWGER